MHKFEYFGVLADEQILDLFEAMEKEGTKRMVFYNGLMDSAQDFLEFVRSGAVFGGFIFRDERAVACIWLTNISGNTAEFHYWTYKKAWGSAKEVADFAIQYLARNTHLTGLVGRTPTNLPLALRMLKVAGFEKLATIPEAARTYENLLVDIVVSFCNLKTYKGDA